MLSHSGTKRTYRHNVKLASLLGTTAGFVNASGFLAFAVLTTNVTGHAALFAERIALQDWQTARIIAVWMLLFLLGAFVSNLIILKAGRNQRFSYVIPILLEIIILSCVALLGYKYANSLIVKEIFAGCLLFAMGLQNALVTVVSGSVIRTTHLTGTFTDLGIELAQWFHQKHQDQSALKIKIKLRLAIILFFMGGALSGAYTFRYIGFSAFLMPALLLIFILLYDIYRIKVSRYLRAFWVDQK